MRLLSCSLCLSYPRSTASCEVYVYTQIILFCAQKISSKNRSLPWGYWTAVFIDLFLTSWPHLLENWATDGSRTFHKLLIKNINYLDIIQLWKLLVPHYHFGSRHFYYVFIIYGFLFNNVTMYVSIKDSLWIGIGNLWHLICVRNNLVMLKRFLNKCINNFLLMIFAY